ncbi:MAG TPA: TIGR00725 family protein [bacterium]|nr:TIGR00725 family protein [bacterium]
MRAVIGVIGESALSDPAHGALAEEVGRRIAEAGCALICGGLGGVMEAAARGARAAGGLTIGVLPGESRAEANPYIAVAVATGIGQMRNLIIVLTADALIAIGGGYGTLAEIGLALRHGRPVVGLRTWAAHRAGAPAPILVAETAEEAVRAALQAARR